MKTCPDCGCKTVQFFRMLGESYAFCSVCEPKSFKMFMRGVEMGAVTLEETEDGPTNPAK